MWCVGCDRDEGDASITWTRVHVIIDHDTCVKGALSEAINCAQGDTWTHLNEAMAIGRRTLDGHEIVAHDREIGGNPIIAIVGDTWTHDDPSIFIRRLSFKENVDRTVGDDSYSFARSDDADHITKWTARIHPGNFPLKTDVLLFFS